jgi:hypothetical protein
VLLTFTAHTTLSKTRKLHEKKTEALLQEQAEVDALLNDENCREGDKYGTVETTNGDKDAALELSSLNNSSTSENTVWRDVAKLVGLFAVVAFINLLKGGPKDGVGPFGLSYCDETCFGCPMWHFFL